MSSIVAVVEHARFATVRFALVRFVTGVPFALSSRHLIGIAWPALTRLRTGRLSTGWVNPTKSHAATPELAPGAMPAVTPSTVTLSGTEPVLATWYVPPGTWLTLAAPPAGMVTTPRPPPSTIRT